jgi:beta-lactamase regulating signal transducer with metallopeptidase domain
VNAPLLETISRELLRVSLLAAGLTAGVALLLALLHGLAPRWRAWIWWLVAARLLAELAGVPAFELPLLAPVDADRPPPAIAIDTPSPSVARFDLDPTLDRWAPAATSSRPRLPAITGWQVAASVWLAGLVVAGILVTRQVRRLAGLVRRAEPVTDAESQAALARAAARAGSKTPVRLLRSEEVAAPMVVGLLRPAILVPAEGELAGEDLALALEHELVHVRRGDAWRALAPALTRRLLFFHPLVRLAEREYRLATEAACDAEVLSRDGALSERYGRLLVRFAAGRGSEAPAGAWSFAASPIFRRLDMMVRAPFARRRLALLAPILFVLVAALAVPVRVVATPAPAPPAPVAATEETPIAEPTLAPEALPDPTPLPEPSRAPRARTAGRSIWAGDRWATPPTPPAPPVAPTPLSPMTAMTPLAEMAPIAPMSPMAPPPPTPAMPPLAPMAPVPPLPPMLSELDGIDWLVLAQEDWHLVLDASRSDQARAERLAAEEGRPILLVGRDGRRWVIRDDRAIAALRSAVEEGNTAARQQMESSRDQQRLAERQMAITRREAERSADLMARQARAMSDRVAESVARDAERIAELERRLRDSGDATYLAARERARAAADELAALARELEKARTEKLEGHEVDSSLDAEQAGLDAQRRQLATRLEETSRRLREQNRELGRRLGRMLSDAIDRGDAQLYQRPQR